MPFAVDGGQASGGFERFTADGWGTNDGPGGGAQASGLLRLDAADGSMLGGTYIMSRLSNGDTKTVTPTGLRLIPGEGDAHDVFFGGAAFFMPLSTDRTRMTQASAGSSPFDYRLRFDPTLGDALAAEAAGLTNAEGVTGFATLSDDALAPSVVPLPASARATPDEATTPDDPDSWRVSSAVAACRNVSLAFRHPEHRPCRSSPPPVPPS